MLDDHDPHSVAKRPDGKRRQAWISVVFGSAALILLVLPVARTASIPLGIAGWVLANRASAQPSGLARLGKILSVASIVIVGILFLFLATALANHY